MPDFSICCLDSDGRLVRELDLTCADGLAAFKLAHEFCGEYCVELWQGNRKLYVLARGTLLPRVLSDDL